MYRDTDIEVLALASVKLVVLSCLEYHYTWLYMTRLIVCYSWLAMYREYKSREVAQSPIYVIVHSVLEVSF